MPKDSVVLTPTKVARGKCIKIERKKPAEMNAGGDVHHAAGGRHQGIVINKEAANDGEANIPAQLQLEFRCFLINTRTHERMVEQRKLRFWFAEGTDQLARMTQAYDFFKELVHPAKFPRDYANFLKKATVQMHSERYMDIQKVDVEMAPLDLDEETHSTSGLPKQDNRTDEEIVCEQLLHTLESAYPNMMGMDDLCRILEVDQATVTRQMQELAARNLINESEPGRFMRQVKQTKSTGKTEMVKTMPMTNITKGQKPSVAIITANYHEKLAVDSMILDKTTFVKYKKGGESNVYTIGIIGKHKVISTKLPMVGRERSAQISAGNTTTRLMGTFPDIEHVLLVGLGGAVANVTDFYKHPRLGDVIVSVPGELGSKMFTFCDSTKTKEGADGDSMVKYVTRDWNPKDKVLMDIANQLRDEYEANPSRCVWEEAMEEGMEELAEQETDFSRPAASTDRLFINIGDNEVIEVSHPPCPPEAAETYRKGRPALRFGPLGAGRPVTSDELLRQDFAARYELRGYDVELDQVVESVVGNRKDSFIFIRGVADYLDGQKSKEWQPYAALVAAGFMKAVLNVLPPCN